MRRSAVEAMIRKQYWMDNNDRLMIRQITVSPKIQIFTITVENPEEKELYEMEITIEQKGCLKKAIQKIQDLYK